MTESEIDIDVFIPTLKKRTNGLLCNVHTVLNSGLNVRVTVSIPDESYPDLMDGLTDREKACIRIIPNVPQGEPSIPIKHCVENVEWAEWLYMIADDDCILPWALQHLWNARKGVAMVMGQVIGTSRKDHLDFSGWKIGLSITECHVSTAMYNTKRLQELPKPWYEIDPLSDYKFIKKFSDHFPHKIIPSVVHVQAFAELSNLSPDFCADFYRIYGRLL